MIYARKSEALIDTPPIDCTEPASRARSTVDADQLPPATQGWWHSLDSGLLVTLVGADTSGRCPRFSAIFTDRDQAATGSRGVRDSQ